eukprot:scaffold1262_cov106-Cylindrotheca_fusiformis.AAC.10
MADLPRIEYTVCDVQELQDLVVTVSTKAWGLLPWVPSWMTTMILDLVSAAVTRDATPGGVFKSGKVSLDVLVFVAAILVTCHIGLYSKTTWWTEGSQLRRMWRSGVSRAIRLAVVFARM